MATAQCCVVTDPQGRETARHGSALFPIACYEDDLHKCFVPWHWHEEFECIVATAGTMDVLVDGTRLRLRPGEGVFINAGALHAVEAGDRAVSVLHSIVFHPRLIGGSRDSVFWQKRIAPLLEEGALRYLPLSPSVPWQQEAIAAILDAWQAGTTEPEDFENFIRYRLSSLFRLLCLHHPSPTRRHQDQTQEERMKVMLRYIEAHYSEELTLEAIAGSACVSGSACLRCFRQMLGTTPIQYVKQLRIEKAAQLLLTTDWQVQRIGMECGFSDLSYFTKVFREEKGCPPKAYRSRFPKRDP